MRAFPLLALLSLGAPAHAQLVLPPEDDRPPSQLAPIDPNSPWQTRFDTVAVTLGPVLGDGPTGNWPEYFGGQWLSSAERQRILALLADGGMALPTVLAAPDRIEHVILGWQPPGGSEAYAALGDRPEADAIICWRFTNGMTAWPATAAEAEDPARHACVRVSYSVRFDPPQWRAFIDAPATPAD